ncbi:class I mannose-6-phosphate isomerase [Curtobacterium sp. VKM Ac-1376]|uniref:class I mannose-6-phosphate isomerase n=1 Tax=Curtobacterium sp. VKM Ac-1376 TaxID=123312 RepID=UPI001889CD5E|nr:class I mannose-6-phosphate isomerase [Curtobacterium sp. VKM Ac-1376]MBF4612987.1 class I mannose-6-phosphate isomerase [Curtobacterium sp. VKM Ac-1376]
MSTLLPPGVTAGQYDKTPVIDLPPGHPVWSGTEAWEHLASLLTDPAPTALAVDTYPGSDLDGLRRELAAAAPDALLIDVEDAAALPNALIEERIAANLTDDRVFGVLGHQVLADFYDGDHLAAVADRVRAADGPVVVYGWGATLVPVDFDTVVLADLARWEIQRRQRAGAPNWRADNGDEDQLRKVKRGYFVEWRVADRHKRTLFDRIDLLLDANGSMAEAKLIEGRTFTDGLETASGRPFRVVPFFDPGVWGGQWMKDVLEIGDADNYAWCFDCVPEENSLLFRIGETVVELPALDLVFRHPRELLGRKTFARFGAEFPIRFDFLDTMSGGNLSLQVHPLTDYMQNVFGMPYTQDESYYMLDATDDAVVYLGLRDDADPEVVRSALRSASSGEAPFAADQYVNTFPAAKHDHFLIPAGTVHCSGADSMVLEISATPYIFTFKMWDWGRLGLDGVPRPVHLDHAFENIQWDRRTDFAREQLVNQVTEVARGDGWVEERTGLHELEFIEVRRHWFESAVPHDTDGTVNVLNLVEGAEAVVESPDGSFEPFVVHYAETFIVPASVGPYTIRPWGRGEGQRLGTVKASVRGTGLSD